MSLRVAAARAAAAQLATPLPPACITARTQALKPPAESAPPPATPALLLCCFARARRLFPAFQNIRAISKVLTARVAEHMVKAGLGTTPEGCADWETYVASHMWNASEL